MKAGSNVGIRPNLIIVLLVNLCMPWIDTGKDKDGAGHVRCFVGGVCFGNIILSAGEQGLWKFSSFRKFQVYPPTNPNE